MSPDVHHLQATVVFQLGDRYMKDRGVLGANPGTFGPARYLAVGQMVGGMRHDFPAPIELHTTRNASGYDVCFGDAAPSGIGEARRSLDPGTYVVRVETSYYQVAERTDIVVPQPAAAYAFDLDPGIAYPFPSGSSVPANAGPTLLRGALRTGDGGGVADAVVEVVGHSNQYRTAADGQWVLVFPDTEPSGNVTVHFAFPDGTSADVPGVPLVAGTDQALLQAALRGFVVTTSGTAVSGAVVGVSGQAAQTRTGADGEWTFFFPVDQAAAVVTVTATLPNGQSQSQPNVNVQPRSTVVVPSFRF